MKRGALLIGTAAALALAAPAGAQTIVMRRPLSVPTVGAQWQANDFRILDSSGNVVQRNAACGNYNLEREVYCVRNGAKVGDAYCREAGEKPVNTGSAFYDDACTHAWDVAPWQDPGAQCTNSETQTRTVQCRRDLDGVVVDNSKCPVPVPASTKSEPDYSTCTYSWDATAWQDPGNACTATETQTRTVQCKRDLDGTVVADGSCNPATKPSTTKVEPDYTTCTHSWRTDSTWTDPGASCTASETQTRAVWCARDLDSAKVGDASCNAATKPGASQQVPDYSGCNYAAANWSPWITASKCSGNTTETRVAQCLRSDGTIVADSECTNRNIALAETRGAVDYSSCTKSWATGAWVDPGASCTGSELQTRAVWCRRDLDGAVQGDGACGASPKPSGTQTVADYTSCSYAPVNWTAWVPSSTCSATATETRTAQCQRSDGTIVSSSECTSRSVALSETRSAPNYSTCTSSWSAGAWNDPGASCTASESQTRAVTCRRDIDGATMPDTSCTAPKPASTQSVTDYSGCSYAATNWSGWTYGSTCSASTTRTQTAQCSRSDGTIVANSECTNRGIALTNTESGVSNYSTCTNSWSAGAWSDPGASCTASESQTRAVTCLRDLDGATMSDTSCTAPKPASSQSVADYSGCSYTPGYSGQSTCTNGSNALTMTSCMRSDGTSVPTSSCTAAGHPATKSQGTADYSGCSYSWATGVFVDPGASCSASETQTRAVWCKRDYDGATVLDGYCNSGTRPSATTTVADYSGCSYSASNWTVTSGGSTCSASSTTTEAAQCQRSDGTVVADSECTNRGIALTRSTTTTNYGGCSYSAVNWTTSAWSSTCSANATKTETAQCQRSDGTIVAGGECTSRGVQLSRSSTEANYSSCTYSPTYGAWGTCTNSSQSRSMTACTRSDGASVPLANCTAAGYPATQSQSCSSGPSSSRCKELADTVMASGPWWYINRPLGSFNGTADYTSGMSAYIGNMGGNYGSWTWTYNGSGACEMNDTVSPGIVSCSFGIDSNGNAVINGSGQQSGYCSAIY